MSKLKSPVELCNNQSRNCTPKSMNIQALDVCSEDLSKSHIPKLPKDLKKPVLTPHVPVQKAKPVDEVRKDTDSQPLDYTGPDWFQYDDQGMILPHSILGDLEDFRNYLEAKGETELLKRVPKLQSNHPFKASGTHQSEVGENGPTIPSGHRNTQSNALQHWQMRMRQRRQQQDLLSGLLHRPVENLLMNQANTFRQTQEQREFLNQVMPLIHSGYGYRVGSEFWSLPQRYGDEMSGITATLTQTEQGKREPITHVGQPCSIRQESGIFRGETVHPVSRAWDQSTYLKRRYQELGLVVRDMDIKKPDIDRLEVIGCGKPFTDVTDHGSPIVEKTREEKEAQKEEVDLLTDDDVHSEILHIPALRFCGQLAKWTGNSITNQGQVGISATIMFESPTGKQTLSHMELHNEGSTAIFYSWLQLPLPRCFPNSLSQTKRTHFYFNSSSGVIIPGDTQKVGFIFKSEEPGIKTEVWQLNTHPVLLQGASIQVTLRGVALYQDKTADQRLFVETKLEKIVTEKTCRSIVYEMLQGVHTPERPSSPAELYKTKEQEFLCKNPKMQFFDQPVEDLKRLWQEANPGCPWDLSVNSLRQVLLDLPDHESAHTSLTREKGLAQFNSLLLQLSEPLPRHRHLTAATTWKQLWRKQLDTMGSEAVRLRHLLGLPERNTWIDKKDESIISDPDVTDSINKDDKSDRKGGTPVKEERSVTRSRVKDDNKGESKSTEESRKKGRRSTELGKHSKEKQGKETGSVTVIHPESADQPPSDDPKMKDMYTRLLHQKVYALMETLVDSLCELTDELQDEQDTHTPT